jgi:hypothetical protein
VPLIADSAKSLAASLIRAGICDDADTGVLIMRQNGGYAGGSSTEVPS